MCRLFLFTSKETKIPLNYIIADAFNSIKKQSTHTPYLPGINITDVDVKERNAKNHLDGYGIAYHKQDNSYQLIKSNDPIAKIGSLGQLELDQYASIEILDKESKFMLAFIRKNNGKSENIISNVQPFYWKTKFFLHNGEFNSFLSLMKESLFEKIKMKYFDIMEFDLDSKILFALLLSYVKTKSSYSFKNLFERIQKLITLFNKTRPICCNISLNFIFCDIKSGVYIGTRYRTGNEEPPSLYYNPYYLNGFSISSEPIDKESGWTLLNNQVVIMKDFAYKIFPLK